jgi:hypothetical protein
MVCASLVVNQLEYQRTTWLPNGVRYRRGAVGEASGARFVRQPFIRLALVVYGVTTLKIANLGTYLL